MKEGILISLEKNIQITKATQAEWLKKISLIDDLLKEVGK